MTKKSIEDVMNEMEDFLNSCKPAALSSNKIAVPREEFDELFGELKVKIPAEIERCKKIMRNKEAILMEARRKADGIIAEATAQANQMVSQTEIMALANQQAYETVEMARVQANDMLAQAVAESNEIRLGSMQYTNDIMIGIRNYVESTMEAERANYENLIAALNNDYVIANANLEEIQRQIVDFTGDPNSVQKAPQMKTAAKPATSKQEPKTRTSMAQKVKQAVGFKEEKPEPKEETKPTVNIPDFITSGEKVVPNETPLKANVSVKKEETQAAGNTALAQKVTSGETSAVVAAPQNRTVQSGSSVVKASTIPQTVSTESVKDTVVATNGAGNTMASNDATAGVKDTAVSGEGAAPRKVKKKIVKKRNPVLHTPQTAQETVAKTLEAAAAVKTDKTVYKANGEQAREIPPVEGRVKRGPRVGRSMVEGAAEPENHTEGTEQKVSVGSEAVPTKSVGVVDDFSMENKF